jgi:hypothetical protein
MKIITGVAAKRIRVNIMLSFVPLLVGCGVTADIHRLSPQFPKAHLVSCSTICIRLPPQISGYARKHKTSPFDIVWLPVGQSLLLYFQDLSRTNRRFYILSEMNTAVTPSCDVVLTLLDLSGKTVRKMALWQDGSVSFSSTTGITATGPGYSINWRISNRTEKLYPRRANPMAYFTGMLGAVELVAAQHRESTLLSLLVDKQMISTINQVVDRLVDVCNGASGISVGDLSACACS